MQTSDSLTGPTAAYLAKLNDAQRRAVECDAQRPLLVIAGAGSGKTSTLAHRVAHLIVGGADPRRILLMTFSRRASSEMVSRVRRICKEALGPRADVLTDALTWAGTFHGVGARLLREQALNIGLDPDFTIHDREDSADLLNYTRHDLGLSKTEKRFPAKGTCLAIYSRSVNSEAPIEEVLGKNFPWCAGWADELKKLFSAYVEAKQAQNVLDYDDLLLYWAQMMREPDLAAGLSARFDHVLVDEYQDTNRLQASILLGLKPDGRGLTAVGDDAQSIYAFRAAEVRNILDFPGLFSPPAEVVTLERNYRSTQNILEAANGVIALAKERFTKNLWTERKNAERPALVVVRDETDQASFVCEKVLDAREMGMRLKDQAVLFRAAHHSGPLEVELTRRNIPYVKFGGLKFLDSAHVKDLSGFPALFAKPARPHLRLSPAATAPRHRPRRRAENSGAGSRRRPRRWRRWRPCRRPGGKRASIGARWWRFCARPRRGPAISRVREIWYEPHLDRLHEDSVTRKIDLAQLEAIAQNYPSREKFLTELTLDPPDATSAEAGPPLRDEDFLILSTIHSSKGQEWKSVFVLNVVDGCIPSDLATGTSAEIEEERRLLYVAMTRAKDHLRLVTPQRFFTHGQHARGDRHVYAARSRFIPTEILGSFDTLGWPAVRADEKGPALQTRVDLSARLRGMWK